MKYITIIKICNAILDFNVEEKKLWDKKRERKRVRIWEEERSERERRGEER